MTAIDIKQVAALICRRLGFQLNARDLLRLSDQVEVQMEQLGLQNFADYYQLLVQAATTQTDCWQKLITVLTNTESYFFRDPEQFELLRSEILPELIRRRSPHRKLTLWSAGCATGEEAYSLAILLTTLIPNIEQWQITVWGTDINGDALRVAERGQYDEWSFRSTAMPIPQKCFTHEIESRKVSCLVQRLTRFAQCNLLDATQLPDSLDAVDLILCRNVFLYFDNQAIAKTLKLFSQVIAPNGYLMTGHSELHGHNSTYFKAQLRTKSRIYQPNLESAYSSKRQSTATSLPLFKSRQSSSIKKLQLSHPIFTTSQVRCENLTQPQQQIKTLIRHRRYAQAIILLEHQLACSPESFQLHYTLACLHTNLKQYSPAAHYCRCALELGQADLSPYYLLVKIAKDQDRLAEAKRHLRQILYFDANAALAYHELARIYYAENRGDRAQALERQAHRLLQHFEPDLILDPYRQLTVQQLRLEMEQSLMLTS
ncbi:MAG: CheR family methyltransferase [Limnothrix sp.]